MRQVPAEAPRVTAPSLARWKAKGRRIPVLTCYDYPTALLLDRAKIPVLLVGDSLGNVVLGYPSTLPVTLEEMIHHARAVVRAAPRALVVVDMPFMSFQVSPQKALEAAGRIIKESGADAVKLEGGRRSVPAIEGIVRAGIPVMGHLGLTPQSVLAMGGYKVQGRGEEAERAILEDAQALEQAGCFSIVLEGVVADVARNVTKAVSIPTIGIGAGLDCDGQVLVLHDMLGYLEGPQPRFVKRFAELGADIVRAAEAFKAAVAEGSFPGPDETYEA